jgi:hypothetical protein
LGDRDLPHLFDLFCGVSLKDQWKSLNERLIREAEIQARLESGGAAKVV